MSVGTTVDHCRTDPGSSFAYLVVMNLTDQFAGRGEVESGGVCLATATIVRAGIHVGSTKSVGEGSRENGGKAATRFVGTHPRRRIRILQQMQHVMTRRT